MTSPPGTPISITPDMDAAPWTDLRERPDLLSGRVSRVGLLRHGTSEGRAIAGLAIQLEDGRWVVAHTTWRLLRLAVRALAAGPVGAEETDD